MISNEEKTKTEKAICPKGCSINKKKKFDDHLITTLHFEITYT